MLKVIGRRIAISIPLLLAVSFSVFLLIDLAPGDAAVLVAGDSATPEEIEETRELLNLNDPLFSRYATWLGDAVQGDLGVSLITREGVSDAISRSIQPTISLAIVATIMFTILGAILGIIAGLTAGRWGDRAVTVATSLLAAVPSYFLGLLLILYFALNRSWFPALGYRPFGDGVGPWLHHLILPAASLAGLPTAELARQLRASLLEVMEKDYIVTARAKGERPSAVVFKHALKNAAIPPVTVMGFRFAQLLGGVIVIEQLFQLKGLASLTISAVTGRDFTMVLGVVSVITLIVVIVNLFVDASYAYFNPRVKAR